MKKLAQGQDFKESYQQKKNIHVCLFLNVLYLRSFYSILYTKEE